MAKNDRAIHRVVDDFILQSTTQLSPSAQDALLESLNIRDLSRWLKATRSLPKKREVMRAVEVEIGARNKAVDMSYAEFNRSFGDAAKAVRRVLGM